MQIHLFQKQGLEFSHTLPYTQAVRGIYHPDQGICLLEIVSPVRSDCLLATNVPNIELISVVVSPKCVLAERQSPLEVNCFDDESQSRADSIDILIHDSLDNSRLSSVVETTKGFQRSAEVSDRRVDDLQHQNSHFFVLKTRFS